MKKLLLFFCLFFPILSIGQPSADTNSVHKASKTLDGVIVSWQLFYGPRNNCAGSPCDPGGENVHYVVVIDTKEGVFKVRQLLRPVRKGMFTANSGQGEKATLHQFSDGSIVVLEK